MICDCSCVDFDPVRCYTEQWRTARKEHTCCECSEPIGKGKRYLEESGIDCEGRPFRMRTCLPCWRIRESYCPNGFLWGGLRETLQECLGFDYVTGAGPEDEDEDERVHDGDVPLAVPAPGWAQYAAPVTGLAAEPGERQPDKRGGM